MYVMTKPSPALARAFAEKAHAGLTYGDGLPYPYHLAAVASVLTRFGFADETLLCGAWLHDAIEDTSTTHAAIAAEFGTEVADLVFAVTAEPGADRTTRNAATYPKIHGNAAATALKLADRIANVEHGIVHGGPMGSKYVREYPGFKSAIYTPTADARIAAMWEHLDTLIAKR